jgi:hypothetical protein
VVNNLGLFTTSVTVIGKPARERDRDHLKFVASQPASSAAAPHRIRTASSSPSNV